MAKMIKIECWGNVPQFTQSIIDKYNGKPATRDNLLNLDYDITFCVTDLNEAHGNFNKFDRSAWLSPRNGDNSFNVAIKF